jgi:hypothetical protein
MLSLKMGSVPRYYEGKDLNQAYRRKENIGFFLAVPRPFYERSFVFSRSFSLSPLFLGSSELKRAKAKTSLFFGRGWPSFVG